MTYRTADESLENYQQLMGDKLGEIFHYIVQEWVQIKILWEQYENLFGKGKERVDLLNKCGGQFFFYVQQILYDTVLLRICKLVDSPEKKTRLVK